MTHHQGPGHVRDLLGPPHSIGCQLTAESHRPPASTTGGKKPPSPLVMREGPSSFFKPRHFGVTGAHEKITFILTRPLHPLQDHVPGTRRPSTCWTGEEEPRGGARPSASIPDVRALAPRPVLFPPRRTAAHGVPAPYTGARLLRVNWAKGARTR